MRAITAFVFASLLIALPATAQTSGERSGTSAPSAATSSATVGVSPGGANTTKASRSCENAGDCEWSLRGRYMRLVNEMARIACGSCARW